MRATSLSAPNLFSVIMLIDILQAVKGKEDTAWGSAMDEDGAFGDRPSGNWVEEMSFA
jgi:hypothetical protein